MKKIGSRLLGLFVLFVGLSAGASAGERLEVGTWNIEGGDHFSDVKETIQKDLVGANPVDVLDLQECPTDGADSDAAQIAALTGYHLAFAGTDCILSRFPIAASGSLLVNPSTGRVAAWADIELPSGQPVRFYSPHLSYKVKVSPFISGIRGEEMKAILTHADANPAHSATIIAGDLNSTGWFFFGAKCEKSLKEVFADRFVDAVADHPERTEIMGRIDWILVRGFHVLGSEFGNNHGSDHHWIRATLEAE